MRRLVLPLAALAILAAPAGAQVAQRYAAPGGSGEACAQNSPCSLEVAVEKAQANDEVIVTGGTYTVGSSSIVSPFEATNLNIHGDTAGPMPVVSGPSFNVMTVTGSGSRVSYLDIRNTEQFGSGLGCGGNVSVDRVRVSVAAKYSNGLVASEGCAVRDSLLLASGEGSTALLGASASGGGSALIRNVTAIATGSESVGIRSSYNSIIGPGAFTLSVKNSIAGGAEADLVATQGIEGPGNIVVANSNFDTQKESGTAKVTDAGANQKAAPIFVDAELGDYTEAPASPTVDAGVVDQLGPLDLAGRKRVQGPAPDIGAYEVPVPEVVCDCLPLGGIRSLSIRPKRFRAWPNGGSIAPSILKSKPPFGARVSYTMSGPGAVRFSVSRKVKRGRYTPLKGSFTQQGAAGSNHFVFSGRIGGRALKPGKYKLTGLAGHLVSAAFEIAGKRHHRRHR